MKLPLLLACLVTPLLAEELPVLAAPDFTSPLDASWKIAHGSYEPKEGVLVCAEKTENKHAAVLWHQVGWNTGVVEMEFRMDGSKVLILGCDGTTAAGLKHVGRFVVTPKQISIAEDSVKPSHTIATLPMAVKPNEWHKLHVEWQGDQMAAILDGKELRAQHPFLATKKARSWLAAGKSVKVRKLTISGEASPTK